MVTVPPLVLSVDPPKTVVSPSESEPVMEPVAVPVVWLRPVTVAPATGAVFAATIDTLTGTSTVPPCPSLTVMVKVSV